MDGGEDRVAPSDILSMDAVADAPSQPDSTVMPDAATSDGPLMGLNQRCSASRPYPAGLTCVDGTCQLECGGNARCGAPAR